MENSVSESGILKLYDKLRSLGVVDLEKILPTFFSRSHQKLQTQLRGVAEFFDAYFALTVNGEISLCVPFAKKMFSASIPDRNAG